MLEIGRLKIKNRLILAPMSGVSDLPFRLVNRRFGCEFAFTEMVNVRSLGFKSIKTKRLLSSLPGDRPLGVQVLAGEEDFLKRGIDILKNYSFDLLDFNAACPARKVTRRGEGAALLREPKRLFSLIKILVNESNCPVTVKIRIGWDKQSINARDVALLCQDAGASAIFIHGRTRWQEYTGEPDYKTLEEVKRSLDVPMIASGNIFTPQLAKKMFSETGCDGLLVARGAFGNPWIFEQITCFLKKREIKAVPEPKEVVNTMLDHYRLCLDFYGPRLSVIIFRKFFSWYTRGFRDVRGLRQQVNAIKTPEGLIQIIESCLGLERISKQGLLLKK